MVSVRELPPQFPVSPETAPSLPVREAEAQEVHYDITRVSLQSINVLQQIRKTFEGIPELSQDIAKKGLMSPVLVAELNAAEADRYLGVINHVWKTTYTRDDLAPTVTEGEPIYRILIAGERRLRAIRLLEEQGCGECGEAEVACVHFEKRFPDNQVPATLCVGISAREALNRQAAENTQMSVPPYEEAVFYYEYYRVLLETVDPNYPIEKFARDVYKSPETIRNALRYCTLSSRLQGLVEQGIVRYGIACALTRYQQHETTRKTDDELYYLALLNKDQRVEDFEGMVAIDIARAKAGQISLESIIFGQGELLEQQKKHVRLTFARKIVQGLHAMRRYIRSLNEALLQGKIGLESSPYSEGSPVRMIIRLAEDLHTTARIFRASRLMSRPAAERVLNQTEEVVEEGNLWLPHTSDSNEPGLNVFGAAIYDSSNTQSSDIIELKLDTKPSELQPVLES